MPDEHTEHYGLNRLGQGHPNVEYTEDMDALDAALYDLDVALDDAVGGLQNDLDTLEGNFNSHVSDFNNHASDVDAHHAKYTDSEAVSAMGGATIGPDTIEIDGAEGSAYQIRDSDNEATGVGVRPTSNPSSGESIFSVESSGNTTRFVVRHNGDVDIPANGLETGGSIHESGDRVATRPWVDNNTSEYSDADARGAIEAGNIDQVSGINGHSVDFDSSSNYIEFNTNGSRTDLVVSEIYLDGGTSGWFTGSHDDLNSVGSSDHHSKYSDSEARSAVDNSNVSVGHADDADTLGGYTEGELYVEYANEAGDANQLGGSSEGSLEVSYADDAGDADTIDGYDVQKDGSGGTGIINFTTD